MWRSWTVDSSVVHTTNWSAGHFIDYLGHVPADQDLPQNLIPPFMILVIVITAARDSYFW